LVDSTVKDVQLQWLYSLTGDAVTRDHQVARQCFDYQHSDLWNTRN
jgi:hypothetical protein